MDNQKYKVKGNELEGVFFTEEIIDGKIIEHIKVEISRQNSNLTEVKKKMATKAKSLGGDAISNFKYGQKKHKAWELVFSFKWDTESWFGEGDVI